jgi:hypothetical protein
MLDKKELSSRLYEMRLHDVIFDNDMKIIRVPGGWIYVVSGAVVFIGFDNEFMEGVRSVD